MPASDKDADGPTMPDLTGMDMDRALGLLRLAGVELPRIALVPNEGGRGTVADQVPEPGARLGPDVPVRLEIEEENPIRFLPEVFQEEDQHAVDSVGGERPAGMLYNFLFIIQQILTNLAWQSDTMHRQLSPEGASESFLPWLAGLIPMEMDATWPSEQLRQVIRDAPALLAKRGTAVGLEEMIRLHTGIQVRLHENNWPHQGVCVGGTRIGEAAIVSTVPRGDDAFYIEVPPGEEIGRAQLERILRLVDAEKPVHLRSCLVQARPIQPQEVKGERVGIDFVVGVSRIPGPVVTPPARLGTLRVPPSNSEDGPRSPSAEVPEENER